MAGFSWACHWSARPCRRGASPPRAAAVALYWLAAVLWSFRRFRFLALAALVLGISRHFVAQFRLRRSGKGASPGCAG